MLQCCCLFVLSLGISTQQMKILLVFVSVSRMDFLTLLRVNSLHEYEIKISKQDKLPSWIKYNCEKKLFVHSGTVSQKSW